MRDGLTVYAWRSLTLETRHQQTLSCDIKFLSSVNSISTLLYFILSAIAIWKKLKGTLKRDRDHLCHTTISIIMNNWADSFLSNFSTFLFLFRN